MCTPLHGLLWFLQGVQQTMHCNAPRCTQLVTPNMRTHPPVECMDLAVRLVEDVLLKANITAAAEGVTQQRHEVELQQHDSHQHEA
jgi:hypothetical protein